MAIQASVGKIKWFEDFLGYAATFSVADATAGTRFNDICLVAISGQSEVDFTVDESNGVISLNGAGGAADGIALLGSPSRPDRNAPMEVYARFKNSSASDGRFFLGFQQTASLSETVNPFTLSGTTLTAGSAGNVAGFYWDGAATTDDYRLMAAVSGTASTSAQVICGDAVKGINSSATTLGSLGLRAGITPTADKYTVLKIVMNPDGSVDGYAGDETVMSGRGLRYVGTIKAGPLATNVLYFPHLHCAATSTGDPIAEVDYFGGEYNRYWGA